MRGHKVILDSDLAELYAVPTKQLVRAVSRNIARFPADFMFPMVLSGICEFEAPFWHLKFVGRPASSAIRLH